MSNKNWSKKHHKKKLIGISCLCIILIILCIISWKMFFPSYHGAVIAEVYQDGTLLYTIPLDKVQEPYKLLIESEKGGKNEISISKDEISVSYADCPDQICVKRGVTRYSNVPIVCMPNHLMIKFVKEGEPVEIDM